VDGVMRKLIQWKLVRCPRDGRGTRGQLYRVGSVKLCESCAKDVEENIGVRRVRVR
jgi:hypothetical protein